MFNKYMDGEFINNTNIWQFNDQWNFKNQFNIGLNLKCFDKKKRILCDSHQKICIQYDAFLIHLSCSSHTSNVLNLIDFKGGKFI